MLLFLQLALQWAICDPFGVNMFSAGSAAVSDFNAIFPDVHESSSNSMSPFWMPLQMFFWRTVDLTFTRLMTEYTTDFDWDFFQNRSAAGYWSRRPGTVSRSRLLRQYPFEVCVGAFLQ